MVGSVSDTDRTMPDRRQGTQPEARDKSLRWSLFDPGSGRPLWGASVRSVDGSDLPATYALGVGRWQI
jgi:hypothetical protein